MSLQYSVDEITWYNIPEYSNVRYSQGIDGCGVQGISTSTLSFVCPAYIVAQGGIPTAAAIKFSGLGKTFYINQRSCDRYTAEVSCVDRAAFLDTPINTADATGADPAGNRYMTANDLIAAIAEDCKGLSVTIPISGTTYGFPVDELEGKTYRELLENITEVASGVYYVTQADTLVFTPTTTNAIAPQSTTGLMRLTYHSYVLNKGSFSYAHVMLDGRTDYQHTQGTGADAKPLPYTKIPYTDGTSSYDLLTVNNWLTQYAAPTNFQWINSNTFTEWECANAVAAGLPNVCDWVAFAQHNYATPYRVTSISARWVGSTIILSLAGSIPSTGETGRRSVWQMESDSKVTASKPYGNTLITPYQGIIFLEEESGGSSS